MGTTTSANMKPCKGGSAERHNKREKELEYIRKDLTPLNCYKEWTSIAAQMSHIRAEYEAATGQKLQATAQPIQEIVLVIDFDTTVAQVEHFCDLIKNLGMTPLSYAIHKDEGHTDVQTGKWVPNYHAHIIVDTTCWEHRQVSRTKKKNGKNIIDPKTGKPVKILVDGYAKTIKFTRENMHKLQDYAAEAIGLKRGVSSEKMHEDARQYKARKQAREIERQTHELEVLHEELAEKEQELSIRRREIDDQSSTLDHQRELIDEQAKTIEDLNRQIALHDLVIRESITAMQGTGKDVVRDFDDQAQSLSKAGIPLDTGIVERRDWLKTTSEEDLSKAPLKRIIRLLQPLSNAITIVAWAASAIASTLASALNKTIKEKEQTLAALTRQIKEQTVWKSTKSAVLSLLNKPATKQAKELNQQVDAAKGVIQMLKGDIAKKSQKIQSLEQTIEGLQKDNQKKDDAIQQYSSTVTKTKAEKQNLQAVADNLQHQLNDKNNTLNRWYDDFTSIAQVLIDHASPELLRQYKNCGLPKLIGENIWEEAEETKQERLVEQNYGGKIHL